MKYRQLKKQIAGAVRQFLELHGVDSAVRKSNKIAEQARLSYFAVEQILPGVDVVWTKEKGRFMLLLHVAAGSESERKSYFQWREMSHPKILERHGIEVGITHASIEMLKAITELQEAPRAE